MGPETAGTNQEIPESPPTPVGEVADNSQVDSQTESVGTPEAPNDEADETTEETPSYWVSGPELKELGDSEQLADLFQAIDHMSSGPPAETQSEEASRQTLVEGLIEREGMKLYESTIRADGVEIGSDQDQIGLNFTVATIKRLSEIRKAIKTTLFSGGEPAAEDIKVLNAITFLTAQQMPRPETATTRSPEEALKDYIYPTTESSKAALSTALQGNNLEMVDELPGDAVAVLDSQNFLVKVSRSAIASQHLDMIKIGEEIHKTFGSSEAFEDKDDGQDAEEINLSDELKEKAEAEGITENDLALYKKYRQQNPFAVAKALGEIEDQPEQTDSSEAVKAAILKAKTYRSQARKNPGNNYAIPDEIAKAPRFSKLESFKAEWQKIKEFLVRENINIEAFDLDDGVGSMESGSDGSSSEGSGGDTEVQGGNELTDKPKGGSGSSGPSRAGSGIEGPKNLKEAFAALFAAADAEFGMAFNPVAQLAGVAA